jgi:hypothetical protein
VTADVHAASGAEFSSYPYLVQEIRRCGLTLAEIGEITGVGERQVQHWGAGTSKPRDVSRDRLVDVHYIVSRLEEVYRADGVDIWLHSRNKALQGQRPLDLLRAGEFTPVLDEVERLATGAM